MRVLTELTFTLPPIQKNEKNFLKIWMNIPIRIVIKLLLVISTVMKVQMINVWKFIIWLSRNDFCFQNLQPSFVDVIESVKSCVRFYLPIFGARFPSSRCRRFFVRQWRARGLFASLVGSNVIVSL